VPQPEPAAPRAEPISSSPAPDFFVTSGSSSVVKKKQKESRDQANGYDASAPGLG
jgi:hypothetical protein